MTLDGKFTDLVEATKGCPQEPEWHAEGDVWTHTMMVCEELSKLPGYRELPDALREQLMLAARMHDIGKPATTCTEEGKIRAPGHSLRGAEILQHRWWEDGYDCPREVRERVISLVRYHGRPLHGLDKLETHVASTSMVTNCRLVALLSEADIRGRKCSDQDREAGLLQIELFREAARELGCLDGPFPWENSHSKFCYFLKGRQSLYQAHDDRTFDVHMLIGLPGSGKSTYSRDLGLPVVSRDEIRDAADLDPAKRRDQGKASQLFQEGLRERLRTQQPFLIDGTNTIRQFRGNTIELCARYGARVHLHVLDRDRATVIRQNKGRPAEVPEWVIEKMAAGMELPDATEAHEVCYA